MAGTRVDLVVEAVLRGLERDVALGSASGPAEPSLAGLLDWAAARSLAFLQREATRAELARTLADRRLPLVLWREDGVAIAVTESGPGTMQLAVADAEGGMREEEVLAGEAIDRLRALGFPEARPTLLLTPVEVDPVLGTPLDAMPGDDHPGPFQRLWQLVVRERRDIGLVYLYATLNGLLYLSLPLGVQAITGLVSGGLILQPVVILILFVIAGSIGSGLLQLMQLAVVEVLQQRVFARMAFEFAFRLPRVRLESVRDEYLPEVMNRFFESVIIQKSLAKLLTETSTAALQVFFGLVLLTFYHPYFAAFSLFLLLVLGVIFRYSGPRGLETSLAESAEKYATVRWLQEIGRSITAFKFAGSSAFAIDRMDRHVTSYLHYRKAHFRVLIQQALSVVIFRSAVIGSLLILGSLLVINRQITLGQFVASEIVIVLVLAGIEKLILSLSTLYDILTSVEKAGHVADLPIEREGGTRIPSGVVTGITVRADALGYRYPGAPVAALSGVTLDVPAGQRVVITGFDGAGQTTLLRVLAGLYHDFTGGLAYDGLPARSLDLPALRSEIGQLLSATDLFDGTVAENIRVGRTTLTDADLAAAIDAVGASQWLATLPHGLESPIQSGGRGLASHLVARLLLAQAIAGTPRLLVMDDFFQNLEAQTRDSFVELLMDPNRPWTVLAVSHDPAFLAAADRVVVMRDGTIVADGPLANVCETPVARAILGPAVVS